MNAAKDFLPCLIRWRWQESGQPMPAPPSFSSDQKASPVSGPELLCPHHVGSLLEVKELDGSRSQKWNRWTFKVVIKAREL